MDSDRDPTDSPETRVKSDPKPELPKAGHDSALEAAAAPPEDRPGGGEDAEARLPEPAEELSEETFEAGGENRLAVGHAAIEQAVRLAPASPRGLPPPQPAHQRRFR